MLPEIGKTYIYFDDGKIRESRKYNVVIKEIIPFDKIDEKTLEFWKKKVKDCYWLFSPNTDYFIKGELDLDEKIENVVFVKTIDDEWFSLGWWGGTLDVDGELNALLKKE